MRLIPHLIVAVALSVGATAAAAQTRVAPPEPGQTEFIGWVRFSQGEFQLYSAERDERRPQGLARCVSGAGSRDEMRQAIGDLGGQKVRIVGRTAPWAEAVAGRIEHEGSDVRNYCGGGFVILADDIRPAN